MVFEGVVECEHDLFEALDGGSGFVVLVEQRADLFLVDLGLLGMFTGPGGMMWSAYTSDAL